MRAGILAVFLALAGCVNLSPQSRWQYTDQLASNAGWQKLRVPTKEFVLSAYVPTRIVQANTLFVYIEGDGFSWLSRSQASDDPTPRNPVGLELALRHPQGTAVYLARPCQYVAVGDARNCRKAFWTDRRFAPEVIEASNQAVSELKKRFGSENLVLIGYSGGAAVAALVAARRNDVVQLVTVAGNLDHRAWTELHHLPPLEGSLNPADEWRALQHVPQRHFVGERDAVVSRAVIDSYLLHFPADRRPVVISISNFDHVCCWVEKWGSIWFMKRDYSELR